MIGFGSIRRRGVPDFRGPLFHAADAAPSAGRRRSLASTARRFGGSLAQAPAAGSRRESDGHAWRHTHGQASQLQRARGTMMMELGGRIGAGVRVRCWRSSAPTTSSRAAARAASSRRVAGTARSSTAGRLGFQMDSTKSADRTCAGLRSRASMRWSSRARSMAAQWILPARLEAEKIVYDVRPTDEAGRAPDSGYGSAVQAVGIIETTSIAKYGGFPYVMCETHRRRVCSGMDHRSTARASKYGAGQTIDIALYDCAFSAMATFLRGRWPGEGATQRPGNRHAMVAPWNVCRRATAGS